MGSRRVAQSSSDLESFMPRVWKLAGRDRGTEQSGCHTFITTDIISKDLGLPQGGALNNLRGTFLGSTRCVAPPRLVQFTACTAVYSCSVLTDLLRMWHQS